MLNITIITARPLKDNHFNKIKRTVEKKYGPNVKYKKKVDSKVIGGIKIVIGFLEINATVQGKLELLKKKLLRKMS